MGLIPGSGRSPGEGNGNPLQYSCLESPMDRGAWRATVQRVAKSQTRLSMQARNYLFKNRQHLVIFTYVYNSLLAHHLTGFCTNSDSWVCTGGFSHTTNRPCSTHQLAVLQFSSALTLSLRQHHVPQVKTSGPHGYSLHTHFRRQPQVQVVTCASEQQLQSRAPRPPPGFGGYARAAHRTQSSILLAASLVKVTGQGSGIARWRMHRESMGKGLELPPSLFSIITCSPAWTFSESLPLGLYGGSITETGLIKALASGHRCQLQPSPLPRAGGRFTVFFGPKVDSPGSQPSPLVGPETTSLTCRKTLSTSSLMTLQGFGALCAKREKKTKCVFLINHPIAPGYFRFHSFLLEYVFLSPSIC